MKQIRVLVWQEDLWHIALGLDFDIASQGASEEEAIDNLKEALRLALQTPVSTLMRSCDSSPPDSRSTGKLMEIGMEL